MTVGKVKDITGQQFGRLTAIRPEGLDSHGRTKWLCDCSCGNQAVVAGFLLRQGHSTSCGCRRLEMIRAPRPHQRTHGLTETPIYAIWHSMVQRCCNERQPSFPGYGGRGITVCAEWLSFDRFYADFGHLRPTRQHTMDRRDNDAGYHPGNVRWVLQEVQNNNRRDNVRLTFMGETLTVTQWSRRVGISASCLFSRVKSGWPVDKTLTLPANHSQRVMPQKRAGA